MKTILTGLIFTMSLSAHAVTCKSLMGDRVAVGSHNRPSVEVSTAVSEAARVSKDKNVQLKALTGKVKVLKNEGYAFTKADLFFLQTKVHDNQAFFLKENLSFWLSLFSFRGFEISDKLIINIERDFIENLQDYSVVEFLNLSWAVSTKAKSLSYDYHEAVKKFFVEMRTSFTRKDLLHFTDTYTNFHKLKSSRKVVNEIQLAFTGLHNQFSIDELSKLIRALSKTHIKMNKKFQRLFFKVAEDKIADIDGKNLKLLIDGVSHLEFKMPDSFKGKIINEVTYNLEVFSQQSLLSMVYFFYVNGNFKIAKEIISSPQFEVKFEELSPMSKAQVHIMKMYFKNILGDNLDKIVIDKSHKVEDMFRVGQSKETYIENQVEKGLIEKNVEFEKEKQVSSGFPVDFYVPSKKLIIQVDGPTHFLKLENGQFVLRNNDKRFIELHEALGYQVLRIPFYEIGAIY